MLVTGKPGTGKSHFIKMVKDAIHASDIQGRVICTSYNGIAAVNVGGTTASALFQLGKDNVDVAKLRSELHIEDGLALLVIDEISTLSSRDFAKISDRLITATGVLEPFGNIPVLLVGDFSQLPPVFSDGTICDTCINVALRDRRRREQEARIRSRSEQSANNDGCNKTAMLTSPTDSCTTKQRTRRLTDVSRLRATFQNLTEISTKAYNHFRNVQWMELTEQVRSEDSEHDKLIDKMATGVNLSVADLDPYEALSADDLQDDDSRWSTAPILVVTNRE